MRGWSISGAAMLLLSGCGARTLGLPNEDVDETAGGAAGSSGRGGSTGAGARAGNGGSTSPGGASGSGGRGGTGGSFSGTRTVTLETDSFVVNPGAELFRCQMFQNPFGTDVDVLKTESHMPLGSHHLGVFFESGATDGALYACGGLQFSSPLHQSQIPDHVREYPQGIGMRMEGHEGLRFVMHYLNTTTQPITAKVALTISAATAGSVEQQAGVLFFNTMGIDVPPRSPGSATGNCAMPPNINLLEINSHMHMHATHVVAKTGSGLLLFESNDWSDPVPRLFSPPLALGNDTQITWTCTYQNDTDQRLSFGESAATNEMCIIAGTFYPALDGRTHACLF